MKLVVADHLSEVVSSRREDCTLRPTLELYDLDADPSELHNLAEKPEMKDIQHPLMAALQEKIILDSNFVPPVLQEAAVPQPQRGRKK